VQDGFDVYSESVKRLFDIAGAAVLLVAALPLLLAISILVRLKLGRPVLYRHRRPGRYCLPFVLIKFRTMTDECDADGNQLPDSERLPKFGQFLRSTSLDELPELWNVLRGEMSLVGPRPLLLEYVDLYSAEQARRHEVRPGITGWAQVNGRNALSWEEKFALDIWYVDNRTMLLDIKILLLTVIKVLKKEDISHQGQATMEKFTGNKQ
jgi:lipopolysaccharide/colanic/teichoic acid biosynthesis glycosyltransferase